MFAALREVAVAKGNRTARLREVLLGKAPALRRETGPVRFPWLNVSQEKAVNQVCVQKEGLSYTDLLEPVSDDIGGGCL